MRNAESSEKNTKNQKPKTKKNADFFSPLGVDLRVAGVSTPTDANVYMAVVRFFKGCHQGDPETLEGDPPIHPPARTLNLEL